MNATPEADCWLVALAPAPGPVPPAERVRRLLKYARRVLGLRAAVVRRPTLDELAALGGEWWLLVDDATVRKIPRGEWEA